MPRRVIRRDLDIPRGAARERDERRGQSHDRAGQCPAIYHYARAVLLGRREIAMELAPQGGGEKEEKRNLPMQQHGDGVWKLFVCPWSPLYFSVAVAMMMFWWPACARREWEVCRARE